MKKNSTYSFDLDGVLLLHLAQYFILHLSLLEDLLESLQESLDYLIHKNCNSKYTKKGILIWGFLYSKLACLLNSS